jgi:uncharacterized protein (UPF0332 family)
MSLEGELQAMLQKARRYVDSAEMLAANRDYDSAASRLYYAMFYCAEALLWTRGQSFSRHRAVIAAFGRDFVQAGLLPAELHRALRLGFNKRHAADYEFGGSVTLADVTSLAGDARRFVEQTQELLKRERRL